MVTSALTGATKFSTPGTFNYVVPTGVSVLSVKLWGAGGGGGGSRATHSDGYTGGVATAGGSGGYTYCQLAVTSGQMLTVIVGGGGQSASLGYGGQGGSGGGGAGVSSDPSYATGGGGGRSAVRVNSGVDAATAGGGGGGGGKYTGWGGNANNPPALEGDVGGQCGGGLSGCSQADAPAGYSRIGGPGTQTAGGAGGVCYTSSDCSSGTAGSQYQGGNAVSYGGGGGGGYFGGGGGGVSDYHVSGGGGGSGYIGGCITASSASYSLSGTSGIAAMIPLPPAMNDADYVSGVGIGGQANSDGGTPSAGGDGLVVISAGDTFIFF